MVKKAERYKLSTTVFLLSKGIANASVQYKPKDRKNRMYKLLIFIALTNIIQCQDYIKEANMWALDKDSFWKIAHRMEVHSIIELYSSDSWCGKFQRYLAKPHLELKRF